MNKCARDALFGMSKLPEKSGGRGRLLRSGKMPPELEPASAKAIQSINDSFLVFAQGVSASRRGFAFVLGLVIGCAGVSMILADIVVGNLLSSPNFWPSAAAAYGVLLLIACCFFAWSAVSVLRPMAPPVVLSRRHRHFYSWLGPKAGWVITNYDEVQPVSMVSRSYSLAGAATGYVLAIVDCDDSDRRINLYVPLAQPHRDVRAPEMIWEFVRIYMDGESGSLPEVDPLPSPGNAAADLALMDRQLYGDLVDDHHRVRPGSLAFAYVAIVGAFMYWFEKAGLWIYRVAPRPEWPEEIRAEMMSAASKNSYRVRALTEEERLAYSGKLRSLNRRWALLGFISTVIVLMMFAVLGIPPWFSDSKF